MKIYIENQTQRKKIRFSYIICIILKGFPTRFNIRTIIIQCLINDNFAFIERKTNLQFCGWQYDL